MPHPKGVHGEYEERIELARFLRDVLRESRLSMRALAKELHHSKSQVANLLSGERTPTWEFVQGLIKACNRPDEATILEKAELKWKAASRPDDLLTPTKWQPRIDDPAADEVGEVGEVVRRTADEVARAVFERFVSGRPALAAEVPEPEPTSLVTPAQVTITPARVGPIPEPIQHFTGRDTLLEQLAAGFTEHNVQVLCGPFGSGKTHTAAEYVHRYERRYDFVAWILADELGVEDALAALAPHLDLERDNALQGRPVWSAVLDRLKAAGSASPWLLIFENAERARRFSRYIPQGGHVLITSYETEWQDAGVVPLGDFTRAESLEFLEHRLRGHPDLERMEELVAAAGDLPLGLEQAATAMAGLLLRIDDFVAMLNNDPTALLFADPLQGYPRSMGYGLSQLTAGLRDRLPDALTLFQHSACCPLDAISIDAERFPSFTCPELNGLLDDRQRFRTALNDLIRSGLARVDATTRTVRINKMIRAYGRLKLVCRDWPVMDASRPGPGPTR